MRNVEFPEVLQSVADYHMLNELTTYASQGNWSVVGCVMAGSLLEYSCDVCCLLVIWDSTHL